MTYLPHYQRVQNRIGGLIIKTFNYDLDDRGTEIPKCKDFVQGMKEIEKETKPFWTMTAPPEYAMQHLLLHRLFRQCKEIAQEFKFAFVIEASDESAIKHLENALAIMAKAAITARRMAEQSERSKTNMEVG